MARAVGYTNAGTIEFLLDEDGRFYFLEMNTRLQVEHPITEMVTGLDLVRWQIRIARGERLDVDPAQLLAPNGHAIECRIYAEDPDNNFLPSPGRIQQLRVPAGPGIRDDSGATAGLDVPIFYDPMISKLVAWAEDRPLAIARMQRALDEYLVTGIKTTVPFFAWLLGQPDFQAGRFHTTYLDEVLKSRNGRPFVEPTPAVEELAAVRGRHRDADVVVCARGRFPRIAGSRPRGRAAGRRAHAPKDCAEVRCEVEIGGRLLQVVVTRAGDGFAVSVDGRSCQVDATRIDAQTLSLIVDRVWSKEVTVAADPVAGQLAVHVGRTPVAGHAQRPPSLGTKKEGAGTGSGPQRLVAPMPGKVVRVLGRRRRRGRRPAALVVVEAMKMENELRASREGTIAEIHVAEGMSVDAGALLLVIQ